jgi:sulfate permease, SulP family
LVLALILHCTHLHRSVGIQGQHEPTFITEPLSTLTKAFSSYGSVDAEHFRPIENYLERRTLPQGYVLWKQNDLPDGLYIIESGILRASYKFADHTPSINESMMPGTLAGEMSALSNLPRNATVIVEQDATVWMLSTENLARLELEQPKLARTVLCLILKGL